MKPLRLAPGENALAGITAELLDLEIELDLRQARQVTLNLRGVEIVYDPKAGKLNVLSRALTVPPLNGKLVLRALVDRTSIELFANRGEVTHTVVFFAPETERRLSLSVAGGAAQVEKLAVRELKSIWPQ